MSPEPRPDTYRFPFRMIWFLTYAPLSYVCIRFIQSNLAQWDMGGHLIASLNFSEFSWPNLIGWNPNQFSGYPQGYFYPSLFHWVTALVSKILPDQIAFKTVVTASTLTLPLCFHRLGKTLFPESPSKALNVMIGGMFLYFIPKGPFGGDLYSSFRIGLVNHNWAMNFFLLFLSDHWRSKGSTLQTLRSGFWLGLTILSHALVGLAAMVCMLPGFRIRKIMLTLLPALLVASGWIIPYLLFRDFAAGSGINFLSGFFWTADSSIAPWLLLFSSIPLLLLAGFHFRSFRKSDPCTQSFFLFLALAILVEVLYQLPALGISKIAAVHFYRLQNFLYYFGLIPLFYDLDRVRIAYRLRMFLFLWMIGATLVNASLCIQSLKTDFNIASNFTPDSRILVYQGTDSSLAFTSPHQLSNLLQMNGLKTLNGLFAESSRQTRYYFSTLNELFPRTMVWGVDPMPYSTRLAPKHLNALGVDAIISLGSIHPQMLRLLPVQRMQENVKTESYNRGTISRELISAYLFENTLVERLRSVRLIESNWKSELYSWWMSESESPHPLNTENQSLDPRILEAVSGHLTNSTHPRYRRVSPTEIEIDSGSDSDGWYWVKESFFPNWKAFSSDGLPLPLLEAAPSFMAVKGKGVFRLKFELSPVEKVSQWVSLFSVLAGMALFLRKKPAR